MAKRTRGEVGQLVKARRLQLQLTQDGIPGVSSATIRKIESGDEEARRPSTIVALTAGLHWPADALDRLEAGEDPERFTIAQISAASGIDIPDDLSIEELSELARYARFLRSQRGK